MINRIALARIAVVCDDVTARAAGRFAFAVVDEAAELVYAARTDDCAARVLTLAIRKAQTAAVMQRDTAVFREQNRDKGKTLADWGDARLTHMEGGAVLRAVDGWYGGVGVGGGTPQQDASLSRRAAELLLAAVYAEERNGGGPR